MHLPLQNESWNRDMKNPVGSSPRIRAGIIVAIGCALALSGCGYHVVGTGNSLPQTLHTIAVPAFVNKTSRYRVEQKMTQAVVRELLARTSYRVVSDPAAGDAVLQGEVTSLESLPEVYDTTTGRATAMLVTVQMKVSLTDQATKKVLYQNDKFVFRQPYAIATDVTVFFDEQNPALDRMASDFANKLVSAILENF
jgi:outer membrane lipopolysaccharide assembly protein LptE/RlpB